ncbi:DNA-binding transcriptional repressor AcrR, partial [Salmonella enterica]|nr:DNA-binding transcriptional repressor AcrR [Salmonella enterica]ECI5670623.1 DNA-binding transcriptional repressor AcrR [Salmonella enterica subsp. enterica serovar Choleraesuis]EAW5250085.1 DNA-binding transcriptional repressor AcrR [Salmonella enterica]EFS9915904.1 DNA-binding transcriptional repressor AcrR [Salmonella enterica]MDJ4127820.1 DNA-binding transcriptional repressor AcrR [Salmonella enterica]
RAYVTILLEMYQLCPTLRASTFNGSP